MKTKKTRLKSAIEKWLISKGVVSNYDQAGRLSEVIGNQILEREQKDKLLNDICLN